MIHPQYLIRNAARFAQKAHKDQKRKYSGRPYFHHVALVAGKVATWTDDCHFIAAAYLHDVIEDCGVTYEQICEEFDSGVGNVVLRLTSRSQQLGLTLPRRERKKIDLDYLKAASFNIQRIKLDDRAANLEDMVADLKEPDQFGRLYAQETKELMDAIGLAHVPTATYLMSLAIQLEVQTAP